jgi:hypothetical protein
MKRISYYVMGALMTFALMAGNLYAEMVRGQVTAVNKDNQSITVTTQDASGTAQETKELKLAPDAQFSGIQSIDDLEVGDSIQADVEKKMFGGDQIRQISSSKSLASGSAVDPAANRQGNFAARSSDANRDVTRQANQGQSALQAQKPTAQSNTSSTLNSSAVKAGADVENAGRGADTTNSASVNASGLSGSSAQRSEATRSNQNTQY